MYILGTGPIFQWSFARRWHLRRRLHTGCIGVEEYKSHVLSSDGVASRQETKAEGRREEPAKQETVRPCRVGQVVMGKIVQTLSHLVSLGSRSLECKGNIRYISRRAHAGEQLHRNRPAAALGKWADLTGR